jgi:drug/metabolite transporter (DMT)-like permease
MKWILLGIVVGATVLADLLQSREMKRAGEQSVNAQGLAKLARLIASRLPLSIAIVCMAISFFAFMALVQREPISFAVPASASQFVIETLLAKFLLHEHLGRRRTTGALLVFGGVLMLGIG